MNEWRICGSIRNGVIPECRPTRKRAECVTGLEQASLSGARISPWKIEGRGQGCRQEGCNKNTWGAGASVQVCIGRHGVHGTTLHRRRARTQHKAARGRACITVDTRQAGNRSSSPCQKAGLRLSGRGHPCTMRCSAVLCLLCAVPAARYASSSSSPSSPSSPSSAQLDSTTAFTRLLYSFLSSLYSRAASEFAGELGFGSESSD